MGNNECLSFKTFIAHFHKPLCPQPQRNEMYSDVSFSFIVLYCEKVLFSHHASENDDDFFFLLPSELHKHKYGVQYTYTVIETSPLDEWWLMMMTTNDDPRPSSEVQQSTSDSQASKSWRTELNLNPHGTDVLPNKKMFADVSRNSFLTSRDQCGGKRYLCAQNVPVASVQPSREHEHSRRRKKVRNERRTIFRIIIKIDWSMGGQVIEELQPFTNSRL